MFERVRHGLVTVFFQRRAPVSPSGLSKSLRTFSYSHSPRLARAKQYVVQFVDRVDVPREYAPPLPEVLKVNIEPIRYEKHAAFAWSLHI